MKYIDAEKLQKEIERQIMGIIKKQDASPDIPKHRWYLYEGMKEAFNDIGGFIDSLQQEQPEVFDTVAFQKGVEEGRRLEREDVKSTIQSRIDEILGDAQPNPVLRMELQELIKKIEA